MSAEALFYVDFSHFCALLQSVKYPLSRLCEHPGVAGCAGKAELLVAMLLGKRINP